MGLFDRFKKKETEPASAAAKVQHSALFQILEKLRKSQGPAVMMELSRVLKDYVDKGTWVPMPVINDSNGSRLRIVESRGKPYAAMYSDQTEIKASGSIVMTDINKLLEPVFENPEIAGIIIDPETTSLCIDKGLFLKCILHGYLPETHNSGSPQKNWGVGIPKYSKSDLMSDGEMLNFAMHTVLDNEEALSSMTPVSACDHLDAVPNLIFEDNGRFVFVVIRGYCAEKAPVLSNEVRDILQSFEKRYGAICYYAPVGFRSATDLIRFNACLALKGDGFYAKYEGLTDPFRNSSEEKDTNQKFSSMCF